VSQIKETSDGISYFSKLTGFGDDDATYAYSGTKRTKFSERTALVMRYRTVTLNYREVHELSCKIACLLQQRGVTRGDRVIVLAPNSPYWICVFWGTLHLRRPTAT